MTTALEALGMIGDGETAALVSRAGSIEWLCLPRFDSPACCAALLGTEQHGHWSIAPRAPIERSEQRYQTDTMILETVMRCAQGAIRLTDLMPIRSGHPCVIRMVTGLSGSVTTRLNASFRFDYGKVAPWVTRSDDGIIMHVGPDKVILSGETDFELEDGSATCEFQVDKDAQYVFVLIYGSSTDNALKRPDPHEALEQTQHYWRKWASGCKRKGEHAELFRRSLLTLKALIHRPTGGLVAAPTTSLPEQAGGNRNWDYRYSWLRDAAFTMQAFVKCGYLEEAAAWRDWILRAVAGEPDKLQILYRVDGSRRLDEAQLPWLPGYRFAKPVRIGNAAAGQLQLDVYGELLRTLHVCQRAGLERTEQGEHLEHAVVELLEHIWMQPDRGLWESRDDPRPYTYSKVMTWVAIDRYLDGQSGAKLPGAQRKRLTTLRQHIHDTVCREGFNAGLGAFTSYFGGQEVDASLLLLPKVKFLPADDSRMAGTIALIEKKLVVDGLVRRHRSDGEVPEGAFIACSFWLAECQLDQGRRADALATINRAVAICSEVGLLSEQYDVASRRLSGNYPQALSHLALIHALLALDNFDREASHAQSDQQAHSTGKRSGAV